MELQRRGFLLGLGASLFVAPAIVKAENLMPVKVMKPLPEIKYNPGTDSLSVNGKVIGYEEFNKIVLNNFDSSYNELIGSSATIDALKDGFIKKLNLVDGMITGADVLHPNGKKWVTNNISLDMLKIAGYSTGIDKGTYVPYLEKDSVFWRPEIYSPILQYNTPVITMSGT